eukprot:gnl/Dysnectes_brevis/2178_a2537_1050.p1 GENE.gnl/Dysnectes_brevis/2178_a2537_1050~~gnl/Dysnectes_brevis/2178_a2537_1050.p1  ORF type:complete len:520 (-),score=132.27 gnl/Dysnectes_brevis/2178_a2537_1050:172-1731(-)
MQIQLTEVEDSLFKTLIDILHHYELHSKVTLRVAGGWVRDKVLGRESHDIDIAIEGMLGLELATLINRYLVEVMKEPVHRIAQIKANPEKSKHLETAKVLVRGVELDLVNLRTEEYASDSRIPVQAIGTPIEDAQRRDFTINALFYNLHTGVIEDFTTMGLNDLAEGVIRTPLDPLITFRDDPLRMLRAVRFSSRFAFPLVPSVTAAFTPTTVQCLRRLVSKERVTAELKGAFTGPHPALAVRLLVELGLLGECTLARLEGDIQTLLADRELPEHTKAETRTALEVYPTRGPVAAYRALERLRSPEGQRLGTLLEAEPSFAQLAVTWTGLLSPLSRVDLTGPSVYSAYSRRGRRAPSQKKPRPMPLPTAVLQKGMSHSNALVTAVHDALRVSGSIRLDAVELGLLVRSLSPAAVLSAVCLGDGDIAAVTALLINKYGLGTVHSVQQLKSLNPRLGNLHQLALRVGVKDRTKLSLMKDTVVRHILSQPDLWDLAADQQRLELWVCGDGRHLIHRAVEEGE